MKKFIYWLIFMVLAYLGVFVYRRVQALKRLQVTIDFPREIQSNNGFITWKQDFVINNADPVSIKADYSNVDVIINDRFVGKCSLKTSQIITAGGISRIELFVTTTLTEILRAFAGSVYDLIKKKSLRIDFAGVIGSYGFTAPIKDGITVNPSQIFNIF
jgi:hypothetical protein